MKKLIFLLGIIILSTSFSNRKYESKIYDYNGLQCYFSAPRTNATCDVNQCTFRFEGTWSPKQFATLTFRIDYFDCNRRSLYKLVTIAVGQDNQGSEFNSDWAGNNGGWHVQLDHSNL